MARSFLATSSQYLHAPVVPVGSAPFTISVRFNIPPGETGTQYLFSLYNSVVTANYFALLVSGGKVYAVTRNVASTFAVTLASHTYGNWNHACAVFYAPNSRAVFLNGGNKATDNGNVTPSVNNTAVGGVFVPTAFYCTGTLAELGVYNAAVTDEEAYSLSLGASPKLVRPQNLVYDLPLVRDEDNDLVGGIHMDAINNPTVAEHPRVIRPSYYSDTFYSFPVPPVLAIGEVNATIKVKTPQLEFSEKIPGLEIVTKMPQFDISE